MQDEDFRHDSLQDRTSIAIYLQALLDGFARGQLTLGTEGNTVTLHPDGLLEFEIRCKRKAGRAKLKLEIAWREGPGSGSEALTIAAD